MDDRGEWERRAGPLADIPRVSTGSKSVSLRVSSSVSDIHAEVLADESEVELEAFSESVEMVESITIDCEGEGVGDIGGVMIWLNGDIRGTGMAKSDGFLPSIPRLVIFERP